jgi:hypothetical protein
MKDFLKGEKPETYIVKQQHNKTIKHQNIKTQNIKHISGVTNTSEIETPSETSVASTRGASASIENYYRESALDLKNSRMPFYVSVSIKGLKSNGARREVNIDVIPDSADRPVFLKSHTVHKPLKWELFRDLPTEEQTQTAWHVVAQAFEQEENIKAGKIKTRRKYRTVPNFRIGNCACITQDCVDGVKVTLIFGENMIDIVALPVNAEFFTYKGDWKNETECEVI